MEFLTPAELLQVLRIARKDSARNHLMILFAYSHGLRRSEVCAIRISDVKDNSLTIRRLKGSKTTVQPLVAHRGQPLLDEVRGFKEYIKERSRTSGDTLFLSERGGRLSGVQFYRIFQGYAKAAGLPESKQHPHVLKHTLANHLIRNGVDVAYVQARLGHEAIGSTMQYVQLTDSEAAEKAHNALMEVFR